jgi:tetrahydromethanopterin S-methyltransferase subunit G
MSNTEIDTRIALVEQNYQNLDRRLEKVENKIDVIHTDMIQGQASLTKVIIGSASTIVASLISIIVVMLLN